MNAHEATTALLSATEGKERSETEARRIMQTLLAYLRSKHQLSLLPEIIAEAEANSNVHSDVPTVVAASPQEAELHAADIAQAVGALGVRKEPIVRIDSSLVSGFVIIYKGNRIDRSGKRALVDLYRSLSA